VGTKNEGVLVEWLTSYRAAYSEGTGGREGQRDKGKRREHSGKLSSHRSGIRTKPLLTKLNAGADGEICNYYFVANSCLYLNGSYIL
jgi:hypothetical protein